MKKFFALVLVVVMMCSVFTMTALADGYQVLSPEQEDVDPDPVSPQTGYEVTIAGIAFVSLACGAVAVTSAKKARE